MPIGASDSAIAAEDPAIRPGRVIGAHGSIAECFGLDGEGPLIRSRHQRSWLPIAREGITRMTLALAAMLPALGRPHLSRLEPRPAVERRRGC